MLFLRLRFFIIQAVFWQLPLIFFSVHLFSLVILIAILFQPLPSPLSSIILLSFDPLASLVPLA